MERSPRKILVLCTGNSCRSIIMAEALINQLGHGSTSRRAREFPGRIRSSERHRNVRRHGIDPRTPRSKSWDEFCHDQSDQHGVLVSDQMVCWEPATASHRITMVYNRRKYRATQPCHRSHTFRRSFNQFTLGGSGHRAQEESACPRAFGSARDERDLGRRIDISFKARRRNKE